MSDIKCGHFSQSQSYLVSFVKAMYRMLGPFQQHDPRYMEHIQGNTIGHAGSGMMLALGKLYRKYRMGRIH